MQKMAWKFGELEKVATDEGFIWYAELALKSESFGEVPFCLVSADTADVDDAGSCSRSDAWDIDRYVKDALFFLRDELRREYRLSEDELRLLDVPVCDLPFELPQCTFYARDTQWLLGPGALDICEPFGIGVIFEGERPLRVENLEFRGED
ncbi:hypothetical protein [uncultured Campylobacter sp.]|uniref:hypothetical protein n=1 Tax=uncultured Campylobacter sp. TaxID=218934 RepID=UPI0026362293|nr:hypothetical protein [uncultured Campylobacter sp.]